MIVRGRNNSLRSVSYIITTIVKITRRFNVHFLFISSKLSSINVQARKRKWKSRKSTSPKLTFWISIPFTYIKVVSTEILPEAHGRMTVGNISWEPKKSIFGCFKGKKSRFSWQWVTIPWYFNDFISN